MEKFLKVIDGNVELFDSNDDWIKTAYSEGMAVQADWHDQEEGWLCVKFTDGTSHIIHEDVDIEMIVMKKRAPKKIKIKWKKLNQKKKQNSIVNQATKDSSMVPDPAKIEAEFMEAFAELSEIINRHDPMDLVSIGCPDSEYDSEVYAILVELGPVKNENDILDLTFGVFKKYFGSVAGKINKYKKLAREIYFWRCQNDDSQTFEE